MAKPPKLRVGLAQLNLTVGDLTGNAAAITRAYRTSISDGAQLVVFSELALTGYPPEDLLLKPAFVRDAWTALAEVAAVVGSAPALVGVPEAAGMFESVAGGSQPNPTEATQPRPLLYNSVAFCRSGEVVAMVRKQQLPNYAVFDEQRYFVSGGASGAGSASEGGGSGSAAATSGDGDEAVGGGTAVFEVAGIRVGVSVCEDIWHEEELAPVPEGAREAASDAAGAAPLAPVLADQVAAGAELLVSLNASPYHRQKQAEREHHLASQARLAGRPLVYVNQVGGQDELVFDGGSMAVSAEGEMVARLSAFEPEVDVVEIKVGPSQSSADRASTAPGRIRAWPTPTQEAWQALTLATRDYVRKNGFTDVVIGTSGGIDSSLVAAIAVDALSAERVHTVAMPSRYSSNHSLQDAAALARNLGTDHRVIPIEAAHQALSEMLELPAAATAGLGGGLGREGDGGVGEGVRSSGGDAAVAGDLVDQNLQSRIRGVLLMALSNRHGWLVLTTGNKTELSVGYSTLYGDTAGAFAVIKDCPKLFVYELCRWRNESAATRTATELTAPSPAPIPESVLTKPPSAELRPNQLDEDSLPPYELLDQIVQGYVDQDLTADQLSADQLIAAHLAAHPDFSSDPDLIARITSLIDIAEYKRRQSPLGPRISAKSFGKDRRMPITHKYR